MKLKRFEIFFVILAVAAAAFCAGFFLGHGMRGDVLITVAGNGEVSALPDHRPALEDAGELLDLNTASLEELMALPGIGEVLAARIIAYREEHGGFSYPEELLNVPGIGESIYLKFADLIAVVR